MHVDVERFNHTTILLGDFLQGHTVKKIKSALINHFGTIKKPEITAFVLNRGGGFLKLLFI